MTLFLSSISFESLIMLFFLRQVLYRHVMSRVAQKSAPLVWQKLETPSLTMFPPPEEMDLGQTPTTVINCFTISINSQRSLKVHHLLGNTTSPMLFETVTGVTCKLEMTFDCWQDWPIARDNRQVPF